jgi:two-component system alkaline phosphatase synthesis response regulator PhoP
MTAHTVRVLVVEDERGIAMALEDDLKLEGYEVVITGDGGDALRRAREERFDLILLDVMLNGAKDGFDVCRELRRTGSSTPILMLTARTQEAEKVLGFDAGADDYVTKPFGPKELRARIAALLRRTRVPRPAQVQRVGPAEIDFDRGEIRRDDGQVSPLTAIEFRLLRAFVRAPGRILTREQLIADAWDGAFVTDRVVDNHIGSLRRKIERDAAEPRHLCNVRGLGYRFDP